jgi:hypothetical protein
MTPLITELIGLAPDPELYHWFDLGRLPERSTVPVDGDLMALPYERNVIVCTDSSGARIMLSVIGGGGSVAVGGLSFAPGQLPQDITPFTYLYTPEGMRVYGINGKAPPRDHYLPVMAVVSTFLSSLSQGGTAYTPTAKRSLINSRRAAKGKGPILFDWHTVTVKPSPPKTDHQGGTHASPRLHDRRGHWRTCKSGKKVWVRDCKVGDASKGVVFKDYRVPTGEQT